MENNKIKVELTQQVINNIFVFLNRVKYEGFSEVDAINEIRTAFANPIKDNDETK